MRFTVGLLALSLAIAASACSTPTLSCPPCAPGFRCDDTQGICVSDGALPDGGAPDAPATCSPSCDGLTPICNASHHCVACGSDGDCPTGHYCDIRSDALSVCTPGCSDDSRCGAAKCCNKQCVDVTDDPNNCSACGMSCAANHAQASCVSSACATGTCDSGWDNCDGDPKNGCEANLHLDVANCTACGMVCALPHAVNGCSDACYVSACNFGWDNCNANDSDGCETSVLTDTANCGACGAPCVGLPNAAANCTDGNCVLGQCSPGFHDCDGMAQNGCEANLLVNPNNCNGCGNVCPQNLPFCNQGVCAVKPPCKNPLGGDQVHDNGAALNENYCYLLADTVQQRAQKACESHFGMGNCAIIVGGYNGQQYGQTNQGGGPGTIHWHYDNHPLNNCAPNYVIGDVVSPGWCGVDLGSFTK